MAQWSQFYLVRIDFLGFRYHGWQKQPKYRSVQGMIDKTMLFILGHEEFKTLGCGRTDAKVSADDFAFELFLKDTIDIEQFLIELNNNLPSDIRAKKIVEIDNKFNIIKNSRYKEYHYYFSSGEKSHPFNAPLIRDFGSALNIKLMKKAALLFLGKHNFKRYTSKPSANTVFDRDILYAEIVRNDRIKGSFLPKDSYVFKVKSKGFLRYQVRLMVGALINVGREEWDLVTLLESLDNFEGAQVKHIAPSSGLVLHKVVFS
jgi:tRNA pseudouridine38-40 synthase|tara:strand:+ start:1096 stop:1875 length:780 start_codon:yes stop_codon:yes gene_type:complete